jgi:glycopeptide antibiotics resistance protein
MTSFFKKLLVLLPVSVLGFFYLYDHYENYTNIRSRRLLFLALTVCALYGWILLEVLVRKQNSFGQIALQSSFYVYIFMVLTLTGYFILFREVSANGWWENMMTRIERRDHVNLEPFTIFKIYNLSNTQIVGNFIMLMPLGFYFPMLYKKLSHFFIVLFVCFFVSFTIELLQLVTSYRSADVDDVLLNTSGAFAGFIVYKLMSLVFKKPSVQPQRVMA